MRLKLFHPIVLTAAIVMLACSLPLAAVDENHEPDISITNTGPVVKKKTSTKITQVTTPTTGGEETWQPPRHASDWLAAPQRGAVVEIGCGCEDEFDDPPYATVESLQQLHSLGARIIILEAQYMWSIQPPYRPDEEHFEMLSAALENADAAGLYVVVSIRNGPGRSAMHPCFEEDPVTLLYHDAAAQQAYIDMMLDVIERYRMHDQIIAWEPLVEPAPDAYLYDGEEAPYPQAGESWNDLAARVLAAMHQADPQRPVIIEPVNWGGPEAFASLQCFDDDNIIYSLHTYEPYAYTHQDNEPYRAYPGEFYRQQFDREALADLLAPVDAFQQRCHAPLLVGEWGGIRWLPGMEFYLNDLLQLFEQRGWSWFYYAWYDAEWQEQGFLLQLGTEHNSTSIDEQSAVFAPILSAWQQNE